MYNNPTYHKVGMNKFRHKTKHDAFKYGLPALSIIEAAVCIYLLAVWS